VSQDIDAPKTHDLQVLCEMCVECDERFNTVYKESVLLTRYAVIPRYPAEIQIIEADAEKAIECADIVVGFIKNILCETS